MDVEWSPKAIAHMWDRHQVTPDQAEEALADPEGGYEYPNRRSQSGQTGRWLGYSATKAAVLVITLLPKAVPTEPDPDNPPATWWGINGWNADATHRRIYQNKEWKR